MAGHLQTDLLPMALSDVDPLTPQQVEQLLDELQPECRLLDEQSGFYGVNLLKIADKYPPAVKSMIRMIIRRRDLFPGYKETPGFFRMDQFASVVRWYERKCAHRNMIYTYSERLETINCEEFENYIRNEIMPLMHRLHTKDLYKTCFRLICEEGIINCCPAPTPRLISTKQLVGSTLLDEIDEAVSYQGPEHDTGPVRWFSAQNVFLTLHHFRRMDVGEKGMLCFEDLLELGHINPVFLQGFWDSPRCFKFTRPAENSSVEGETEEQEALKDRVETDLSGLILLLRLLFKISTMYDLEPRFECQMEYKPILSYVFCCLSECWETSWSRKHFERIVSNLHQEILRYDSVTDIRVEDMVSVLVHFLNPADPERIQLSDVLNLDKNLRPGAFSQSSLFLGMLVDAKKFYCYDNRAGV